MKLARLLVIVALVLACAKSAGATMPVKFDFQHAIIDGYEWVSGVMTVGDQFTHDPLNSDKFTVNLRINNQPVEGGRWTFRRLPDGNYAVESLVAPEWYLKEVQKYATNDDSELVRAAFAQVLTVADGFTDWLDSQQKLPQPVGYPSVFEELRPVYLAVTVTLQGRLATVTMKGWNLKLEASQRDGNWVVGVIAFERATP